MNVRTFLQDVVAEAVRSQPWYQKNANTIVATLGFIASLLTLVVTLPLDLPEVVRLALPTVVAAVTAFAIKLTPNGVQLPQAATLEQVADRVHLRPDVTIRTVDQIALGIDEIRARVEGLIFPAARQADGPVGEYVPDQAPWLEPPADGYAGQHRLEE